ANNSNTSNESTGKTGTVTASTLNIRSGAGTKYSVVTKASKGSTVEILESSNGWYKVKLSNGKIGWGSGSYISMTTSSNSSSTNNSNTNNGSTESTGKTGTVTASTLNIRSGAGTKYSVVTKASKGSKVEILESSNGWYKVKLSNGKIGWGSGSYISVTTSNNSNSNSNTENTTPSQNKVETVVNLAYAQLGKPYVWGAEGPNSFDCSGLIHYVYKQAGVSMPRTSKEQSSVGTKINKSDLQSGDLIFSSTDGTGGVSHVAIYVGNGEMIHAPRTGKNVEKVSINNSYWSKAYLYAKRVL
ncbi:MAG: C40 family peptidase, partial [Romboutsia sp.]|nr:C40 family peptidase [Romboutsia sp.]